MTIHKNHEISHYLTNIFRTIRQNARDKAAACYENHPLHLLPLEQRFAELCMLRELNAKQASAFDRQEYLSQGDQPQFIVKHFTTGNRYFSSVEKEKYQEALMIIEMRKANDHLLAITGIRIEIQKEQTRMNEAISKGGHPDLGSTDRMNYLQSQLQLLLSYDPDKAMDSPPKAMRGPAKRCSFGFHGDLDLLRTILAELNAGVGYLKAPTTTSDFIKVVTAPVPSLVGIPIYMGCNNKQFVYIKDYFHAMFHSFEPAVIGNSGLFYSKEGNLFNSHNLNCTACDHIEKRYVIDAIFKKHGIYLPLEREIRVKALPGTGGL